MRLDITPAGSTLATPVSIANGGTNSSTALNNSRAMVSSGGAIVESGAITDGESIQLNNTSFISCPLPLSTVEGRLTLTSGTPITTADVTGATTIYFAPYKGNRIYLYDGTRWELYSFTERSLALGTLTNDLPYDVFIYDNSGTLTLEALAWTSKTARATALTTQNGALCKSGALTRRYLGTFHTTSTTTTEDSAAKRLLWNYYNRVTKPMVVLEPVDSWTYGTVAWRQMNNNTANQLAVVIGWSEDSICINTNMLAQLLAGGYGLTGIGEDSTTAIATGSLTQQQHVTASNQGGQAHLIKIPTVGYHYYAALERGGNGTVTWYGDAGSPGLYTYGIFGSVMC